MRVSEAVSVALLGVSLVCVISSGLLHVALIEALKSKQGPHSPYAIWKNDVFGILQDHRRFYPSSKLRIVFVASLGLLVCSSVAFVLVLNLSR